MRWVEELIRQAIEQGEFDHLQGKGKPLHWDEDPFTPPDLQLAYHLLRSNGFTLPWIETRRELLAEIEQLRTTIAKLRAGTGGSVLGERQKAILSKRIDELNQRIRSYNIHAPLERFHLPILDHKTELEGNQ
ncbi:MAG: DUF1992 domain-containing protein [Desulfitobacteriaceae bacterium]|nr:DUF1992 domain-containing protein [Desulfitobacteriaceae bacterium]